jgi:tetratricopeptide (TPR) repeat protein
MAEVIRAFDPIGRLPEGLEALGKVYRSALDGKRALLFFDNARDRAQIEPLLPPRGSLLLVTSRHHFTLPGIYTRRLDALAEADAVALARSIAPRLDEGTAEELAKVCGYLPLALRAAASVLAERVDMKPARYLDRLRGAERVKLVEEVLASSLELLDEPTRAFWLRLGVMPADFDAPAAAAVGGVASEEGEDHLGELVRRSLLEWDAAAERYRLHDLARGYAWARLDATERNLTERRHTEHFVNVAGSAQNRYLEGGAGVTEGLQAFDREWPHIAAAQVWASAHAEGDDDAAGVCSRLAGGSGHLLPLRQHPQEQIRWLEAALAASRQLNNRSDEGDALGNLGVAYQALGETRKAIELFEQRLVIACEVGDRRGEGNALGNLGHDYSDLGETRKAIELYELHLVVAREIGHRRGESIVSWNLGLAYEKLGDLERAVDLMQVTVDFEREIGHRDLEEDETYVAHLRERLKR